MKIVTVLDRQNLLDIALQETGSIESAIDLLLDFPEANYPYSDGLTVIDPESQYGFMSPLDPGQKITIKQKPWDVQILEYYQLNSIKPLTTFDYVFVPPTSLPDFNEFDFNNEDFN